MLLSNLSFNLPFSKIITIVLTFFMFVQQIQPSDNSSQLIHSSISINRNSCENCTVRSELPCVVRDMPLCIPPSNDNLLDIPGKVTMTGISVYRLDQCYQDNSMGLNIKWTIPNDASYSYLKGFFVTASFAGGGSRSQCFHLDLTLAEWNRDHFTNLVEFSFSCILFSSHVTEVTTIITSLPTNIGERQNYVTKQIDVSEAQNKNNDVWTSKNISYQYLRNKSLSIMFQAASPSTHNFTAYEVILISTFGRRYPAKTVYFLDALIYDGKHFLHVTYRNMSTGEYYVMVTPSNRNGNWCVCEARCAPPKRYSTGACQHCASTRKFIQLNETSILPAFPKGASFDVTATIGCLTAIVVLLSAIVSIGYYFRADIIPVSCMTDLPGDKAEPDLEQLSERIDKLQKTDSHASLNL